MIPLPAVRHRRATTVIFPAHPVVEQLFAALGGTLPVAESRTFDALSAVTGTLSTLLGFVETTATWLAQHGVEPRSAEMYVREMVHGLSGPLADPDERIADLIAAHETPGGLNEQLRNTWLDEQNSGALHHALDQLLQRVSGAG